MLNLNMFYIIINKLLMHNLFHMEFESDNETLDSSFESQQKIWDQREITTAVSKIDEIVKQKMLYGFKNILSGFLQNHPEKTDALMKNSKRCLAFNRPKEALDMIERAYITASYKPSSVRSQTNLLYSEILLKNNKTYQSLQILKEIDLRHKNMKMHELRAQCFRKLGKKQEMKFEFEEIQKSIENSFGKKSIQEGLFYLKKGKYLCEFEEFDSSITVINQCINILIKNKLQDKGWLAEAYLSLAQIFFLMQRPYEENINLVCAINVLDRAQRHQELRIAAQKRLIDSQLKLQKYELASGLLQEICRWNQKKFGIKHPQTEHWQFKKNKVNNILQNNWQQKKPVLFHPFALPRLV